MGTFSTVVKSHGELYDDENLRDEALRAANTEMMRRPLPKPVHAIIYGFGPPEARGFYPRNQQKAEL